LILQPKSVVLDHNTITIRKSKTIASDASTKDHHDEKQKTKENLDLV
jgi:hypothetical protein